MRALDLKDKRVVIWGTGREGIASLHFIQKFLPDQRVVFIDESAGPDTIENNIPVIHDAPSISAALDRADIIIKSPGVSLYHPFLDGPRLRKIPITSLLNLWFAEPHRAKTICVTGTKGKSTTASLTAHVLAALGKSADVLGNIGKPISETDTDSMDYIVIETSSYQAASFDGICDVAALTALYPEHLDWHKSLDAYYRDKLNLLYHARTKIINAEALATIHSLDPDFVDGIISNIPAAIHSKDDTIYDGDQFIGKLSNNHLSRQHNMVNVSMVLSIIKNLGLDIRAALLSMEDFKGLPHRQEELGIRNGILYVNDSISTTPQSAIAAMEAYRGKPITLIAGGHDRGIDYTPLVDYVIQHTINAVLCMGPSGVRMATALRSLGYGRVFDVSNMTETVALAQQQTPAGGVILLSPASPSYGLFRNFEERGSIFALRSGF